MNIHFYIFALNQNHTQMTSRLKNIKIVLVLVLFAINTFAKAQDPLRKEILTHSAEEACSHHKQSKALLTNYAASNVNVNYCKCYWEIDPAQVYIKGYVNTHFITTEANVSSITFELDTAMIVDSVIFNSQSISHYDSGQYTLVVDLGTSLILGHHDSIKIFYQGAPGAGAGFGAFIKSTHANEDVIWTLSEPYGAREWWPVKNDLSDKIDSIDIIVRTPDNHRAASNGLLISEITDGNDKLYHWRHRYPIAAYLVAIAVTNYHVYSDYAIVGTDTIEILNYVFPEDSTMAKNKTPNTIGALQLFSNLFIDYPFKNEKYGHAQFGWGGGMEHQTMSFMGSFSHGLIAHELAHQWFGDMATCGSWHDIWLNEGFATYLTGLTYENMSNKVYWEDWKDSKIKSITSDPGGSVYVDDTTSVSRIFSSRLSYNKGSYLLHMLRWVIGDSAFFTGAQNYLNDTAISYSYAKTSMLKTHLENASGKNLNDFFNDWFYGEGYPSYSINVLSFPNGNIDITLNQTPSHVSVNCFKMPVPIRLKGSAIDTIVVVNNTQLSQTFSLNLPYQIDSVFFDPDKHLCAKGTISLTVNADMITNNIKNIEVFPNPANNVVNVIGLSKNTNRIEVVSASGKKVFSKNVTKRSNSHIIDVSSLSAGVYFVEIYSDNKKEIRKFIKK